MNKKLLALVLSISVTGFPVLAIADDGKTILSAGYAQSHTKYSGRNLRDDPQGLNIKVNREVVDGWGVVASLTHTERTFRENRIDLNLKYTNISIGPSYRFNDSVSGYGFLGWANGKVSSYDLLSGEKSYYTDSANNIAVGAGIQAHVAKQVVVDVSWEYTKLNAFKANTWVVGLGYSF